MGVLLGSAPTEKLRKANWVDDSVLRPNVMSSYVTYFDSVDFHIKSDVKFLTKMTPECSALIWALSRRKLSSPKALTPCMIKVL